MSGNSRRQRRLMQNRFKTISRALDCLGIEQNDDFEWTWDDIARIVASQKGEAEIDGRPIFATALKSA